MKSFINALLVAFSLAIAVPSFADEGFDVAAEITSIRAKAQAAEAAGDYPTAYTAYRKLSIFGLGDAQFRLGQMSAEGLGTRKSEKQAAYWYKQAAKNGHPGAQAALAALSGEPS